MLYGVVAATALLLAALLLTALLAAVALGAGAVLWGGERAGAVTLGPEVAGLRLAGGAVALLGLVDDVRRLRRVLLAGTAVAAACVVPYGDTGIGGDGPAGGRGVLRGARGGTRARRPGRE